MASHTAAWTQEELPKKWVIKTSSRGLFVKAEAVSVVVLMGVSE
jgi:hypothetical protein